MKTVDKHEKIIQAAVKVFARNGFFNSRISEIAKEANVADGTIYLYFNNKYDILISLFEEEMARIIANMRQELGKESDALRKLEIFAQVHLRIVEENKALAEVLQVELRQSSKFMKEYRNKRFAEYVNIVSSIIRKGQEEGTIRKDVMPGIAKRAFFGALDEMSRFWVLSPQKKYSITTAAKQISDFFIRGIAETRT
ncbi:MAG: TetR/AcrR family transcriptional regulator [Pseudomonadota bacterium]